MTLEQKRQEIRKKINEACPELLKLEFGCELIGDPKLYKRFYCGSNELNEESFFVDISNVVKDDEQYSTEYIDEEEILGKPPTLEHLLKTIDSYGETIYINTQGEIIQSGTLVCVYDLTKSPLEQSEEVTDFIYQLICK